MRTNGWTCPWHPLQVGVVLFVLFTSLWHFGFLVYYFPGHWRLLGYIVPGLGLVTLVFLVVMTTTINPADPHLRRKLIIGLFKRGKFDRSKHEHVIEDFHCHLCDTDVTSKTKHCRICDKCVEGFDHHCKWLNTCIGSRNYRWFISTLFTSLFGVVSATLMSAIFFILFFSHRDGIRHFCDDVYNISSCDSKIKIFGATVPDPVFPAVTAFIVLLYAIAVVLIGHLTLFHCYLIWKGLSTYDYILLQREVSSTEDSGGLSCLKKKVNRVSPDQELDRESSIGSVGMATFNRTPPESENERETDEPHEQPIDDSDTIMIVAETILKQSDHEESCHSPVNSSRVESLSFSNQDDHCNVNNIVATPQDSCRQSVQLSGDEELMIMLPVEHSPSPEPYPDTIENCEDSSRFRFPSSLPPIDGKPVSLVKPPVDSNRRPLLPLERIGSDSSTTD